MQENGVLQTILIKVYKIYYVQKRACFHKVRTAPAVCVSVSVCAVGIMRCTYMMLTFRVCTYSTYVCTSFIHVQ